MVEKVELVLVVDEGASNCREHSRWVMVFPAGRRFVQARLANQRDSRGGLGDPGEPGKPGDSVGSRPGTCTVRDRHAAVAWSCSVVLAMEIGVAEPAWLVPVLWWHVRTGKRRGRLSRQHELADPGRPSHPGILRSAPAGARLQMSQVADPGGTTKTLGTVTPYSPFPMCVRHDRGGPSWRRR